MCVARWLSTNHMTAHPSDSWKLRAISVLLLGSVQTMRVSEDQISFGDSDMYVGRVYLVASESHPLCISWSLEACDQAPLRIEPELEVLLVGLHYSVHATPSAKTDHSRSAPYELRDRISLRKLSLKR